MDKEEQTQIIIENLWKLLGDARLKGLTVYEAAIKIGASPELAKKVQSQWTGPTIF